MVEHAVPVGHAREPGAIGDAAIGVETALEPHRVEQHRQRARGVDRRSEWPALQHHRLPREEVPDRERDRHVALLEGPDREHPLEERSEAAAAEEPQAGPEVPEVLASEPEQLLRIRAAGIPAPQSPPTRAPALEPAMRAGRSPCSSSTETTPAWAKKPKNPDDITRVNGFSASQSRRVRIEEDALYFGGRSSLAREMADIALGHPT